MQGAVARRGVADVTMLDGLCHHGSGCFCGNGDGCFTPAVLPWDCGFAAIVMIFVLRMFEHSSDFSYSCDWLLFYIVGVVIITFSFCFAICVFMPPACLMSLIIADIRCQSQDYKWWS